MGSNSLMNSIQFSKKLITTEELLPVTCGNCRTVKPPCKGINIFVAHECYLNIIIYTTRLT